jgi:hypothetical protein
MAQDSLSGAGRDRLSDEERRPMNQANRRDGLATATAIEDNATRFWQDLVEVHWEKQSTSFDCMPPSLWRLDSQHVFRLLTWCGEHIGESEVRCYRHRSDHSVWQLCTKPQADVLPMRADGSLARYHERMRREIPRGDGYSIFVNEVIRHDPATWIGVRDFVRGLVQHVGLPTRGFDSGVGLGQYDFTPFGLHVDQGRSAFVLPVVGRKHFRIWPGDYVRQHQELVRSHGHYGPLVKDSLELETGPGGLLYWPSDAWHIAEGANDGHFTVMVAVGALLGTGRMLATVPCEVDNLQESAQNLPDGFAATMEGTHIMKRGPTVEHAWMAFLSGLGLRHPIPMRQDALPGERLHAQRRSPILWRPLPDAQFAVGVNGHCLVESGDWIPEVLDRINAGSPFEVSELVAPSASESARTLCARLWACRALESDTRPQ